MDPAKGETVEKESPNTTPSSDFTPEEILNMELERAGIPKRYRGATWENFEAKQIDAIKSASPAEWAKLVDRLNDFKEWRGEERTLVFLTGRPGCGKTHLAVATMRLRPKNDVCPVLDLAPASCYDSAAATQAWRTQIPTNTE